MNFKTIILLLFFFLSCIYIFPQDQTYSVQKASFSSDNYDEFSPVFYKNGIVFCSNRSSSSMINYSNSENSGSFSIYYISNDDLDNWKKAELFSKDLNTKFNDGPATFSSDGNIIYYSRNVFVEGSAKKYLNIKNKLGVFTASLQNGKWNNVSEYRLNSDWYNITTPCLSPDGQRLYFASDRPDGYGGADLYYSQWNNGYWEDPVNLGPEINTTGNESYPFMNEVGELFFSSDGHQGFGGKDIFVTKQLGDSWYPPHRLEAPINSEFNDFGIVTDTLMYLGYFSSDREKTLDIYKFQSERFPVWFSTPQLKNNYCISMTDTGIIKIDSLILQYEWELDNQIKVYGPVFDYCFTGPGKHEVRLNIVDVSSADIYFHKSTYYIAIRDKEQAYINCSDFVSVGEAIDLDGLSSFTPGYIIEDYFWEFGDSSYAYGAMVSHFYDKPGVYPVELGLTLRSSKNGKIAKTAVSKDIIVFETEQERIQYIASNKNYKETEVFNSFLIDDTYSAESDIQGEAVFRIEILQADNRVEIGSYQFFKIPNDLLIKEIMNNETKKYSYYVCKNTDLMSLYLTTQKLRAAGNQNVKVMLDVLKDPAEKELYRLERRYGNLTDEYFNSNYSLVTNGILMLNQIAGLLKKYPHINIEIGIHTDNIGTAASNLLKSKNMAQIMTDYLVGTGINRRRLTAKGYGESYPTGSNIFEADRINNRRIEFLIYK